MLNIVQDEYLPNIAEASGARIVVHNQARMPFPEDEGLLVNVGTMSSIGLRQVWISSFI